MHVVAKDGAGNVGIETGRLKIIIKTIIETNADNTFSLVDGTKVEIPAGSVASQTKIEISSPLPVDVPRTVYDTSIKGTNVLKEIKLADGTINLQKEATITIPYNDSDIAGLNESNLKIIYYDESTKKWKIDLNSTVSASANKIIIRNRKMTVYRIVELSLPAEAVDNLSNYPNPVIAGAGRTTMIRYSLKENSDVELKIYDLIGELVLKKDIAAGDSGGQLGPNEITWDCKNGNGDYVGAGGYVCIVKVGGKSVKTKIGVK